MNRKVELITLPTIKCVSEKHYKRTMEAHASAVENDSLLVNDLVLRSESLLALWHDCVVDKFGAANMIVDQLWCCDMLGQPFDVVLTL